MRVTRSLGERALEQESLLHVLNAIVMPALRELVRNFNGLSYEAPFTNGQLEGGMLTVTHDLGARIVAVTVIDDTGALRTLPDTVVLLTSLDELEIDMSSFGALSGTWRVLVQRG